MTKKERDQIRKAAASDHKGNLEAAACDFLDASLEYKHAKGVPLGFEAAVGGIVDEIRKYADADAQQDAENAAQATAKTKK